MNNENLLITDENLDYAKNICKYIKDSDIRNRAVANVLAADIALKYFEKSEVDTKTGLHNIPQVLHDIDVSDIYVKGNYIDVRIYFGENELCVPKSHYDLGILPVAYMFIKVAEDLRSGIVTGFILPEKINTSLEKDGYYGVSEEQLVSYYEIESILSTVEEEYLPDDFEKEVFSYLDNDGIDKQDFFKTLITRKKGRVFLQNAAKAQNVFESVIVEQEVPEENILEEESPAMLEEVSLEDNLGNLESDSLLESDSDEAFEIEPSGELEDFGSENNDLEDSDLSISLEIDSSALEEDLPSLELDVEELPVIEDDSSLDFQLTEVEHDELDIENQEENDEDSTEDTTEEPEEDFEISTETQNRLEEHLNALNELAFKPLGEDDAPSFFDTPEELPAIKNLDEDDDFKEPAIKSLDLEAEPAAVPDEEINIEELDNMYEPLTSAQEEKEAKSQEELEILEELEAEENDTSGNEGFSEFKTQITESLRNVEEASEEGSEEETEESIEETEENSIEYSEEAEEKEEESSEVPDEDNSTQIDNLFSESDDTDIEAVEENSSLSEKPAKKVPFVAIAGSVLILATVCSLGYFGYNKYMNPLPPKNGVQEPISSNTPEESLTEEITEEDAMPVETVENTKPIAQTNEGNAISIPAIEKNLDASIIVSNLNVNWEVPSNYVSNSTASRYFTKMGKIIQLNLKTELLLLSKPPITNKIMLELSFNKSSKKFEIKNITASSGEKTVDDLIVKTVTQALDYNIMNMSVFNNLNGNPVLVIRL